MDGGPEGFSGWYAHQHPRVLGMLVALSGQPDVAAEATDEAFVRAFERWARVRVMDSPQGWVARVALNELRRRMRRRSLEQRLRWRWVTRPDAEVVVSDAQLWVAVRALPERQREMVVLRYVADLAEGDIAVVLGVSRGTVASTLSDARRRLAGVLDHQEVERGHA